MVLCASQPQQVSLQQVPDFLEPAIECSVYLDPRQPGLSYEELAECGRQAGFKDGKINDVLVQCALPQPSETGGRRV